MDEEKRRVELTREEITKILLDAKKRTVEKMEQWESEDAMDLLNQEWGYMSGTIGTFHALGMFTNGEFKQLCNEWQLYNPHFNPKYAYVNNKQLRKTLTPETMELVINRQRDAAMMHMGECITKRDFDGINQFFGGFRGLVSALGMLGILTPDQVFAIEQEWRLHDPKINPGFTKIKKTKKEN